MTLRTLYENEAADVTVAARTSSLTASQDERRQNQAQTESKQKQCRSLEGRYKSQEQREQANTEEQPKQTDHVSETRQFPGKRHRRGLFKTRPLNNFRHDRVL